MVLLKNFLNILYVPELRKKLLFTLGVLIVYRLGCFIPVVGIDLEALKRIIDSAQGLGALLGYLDLFSGGSLSHCALFSLGVMPYITASIMMQLLSLSVPTLEQLSKEGEYGRRVINQYTRYLALGLSVIQSLGFAFMLERSGLVVESGFLFRFIFVLSLTVGSTFVMWLGEQISLFGIGNGSSLIIFSGIVARFPDMIWKTIHFVKEGALDWLVAVLLLLVFVAITACIVMLEKAERKVPVQYSRRIIGNRVYGGQSTYIPFKINTPGVMPVIFAGAVLNIPMFIASYLGDKIAIFKMVSDSILRGGLAYSIVEFVLIICFSYFYTALIYDPNEMAENLKKSGGFIPGIRPGRQTADFFSYLLMRIGLVGAIYLAALALMPNIIRAFVQVPFMLGGTSLLIVVGVALDLAAQIESYLIEHRYEGFLTSGRMKGRSVR